MSDETFVKKTAVGAAWMIGWRALTRVLGMVSTLVLARILVPADFGLVAMATTFSAAVDGLSEMGLVDALVRCRSDAKELLDTAFSLQVARAVLTALILTVGAPIAVWWFHEPRLQSVILVLAAGSFISGFENIGVAQFRREMDFKAQFKLLAIPRLLQVAITIPLALLWRSYWVLLVGILVARLSRILITYTLHAYRPRFRLSEWRQIAGFSFWTWLTVLVSLVWERSDPFILGPHLGVTRLGLYLLAFELGILPVTELISPSADALFAGFAQAQRGGYSSIRVAPLIAGSMFLCILPLVAAISTASGYIVAVLLGAKWTGAQQILAILVWSCAFSSFSFVSSTVLVANGYLKRNLFANLMASCIKLVVLLIAVSQTSNLSIIAAAAAICVAAESAVYIFLLKGTGEVVLGDIAGGVTRGLVACAIALAVVYLTGWGWHTSVAPGWQALLLGVGIGSATILIYAAVEITLWVVMGRPVGPEEVLLKFLQNAIARQRERFRLVPRPNST